MPSLQATLTGLLGSRARPDVDWLKKLGMDVSSITQSVSEVGDQLATEMMIRRTLEYGRRNYYAQFPAPIELYVITRIVRPRHIIESGVSSGLSSAHFLMGLRKNGSGTLHSIDLPQYQKARKRGKSELSWCIPKGKDSGWAVPRGLKKGWDLRKGRSEDFLPSLVKEVPSIDIFCHDSPWTPEHLDFEFEAIRPKLRSGSVVVADNTGYNPRAVARLARDFSAKVFRRKTSDLIGVRIP